MNPQAILPAPFAAPSMAAICDRVAEAYRFERADILGPRRPKRLAFARQVAMSLAHDLTGESLVNVGAYFGGRDHGTVIHAKRRVADACDTEPRVADFVASLRDSLTRTPPTR